MEAGSRITRVQSLQRNARCSFIANPLETRGWGTHNYILNRGASFMMQAMKTKPEMSEQGGFARLTNFMDKLLSVPHSEIKSRLDAEKRAKKKRKARRLSASRV